MPALPTPEEKESFDKAVKDGNAPAVEEFLGLYPAALEMRDNSDWTPLMNAAWYGHKATVTALLRHGSDVNATTQKFHETALMQATKKGHAEIADLLLLQGAAVDAQDIGQRTPLIFAALAPDCPTVDLLLDAGAAVNAQDSLGHTPLMYAAMAGDRDSVTLLLMRGADIDMKDHNAKTALALAREFEHVRVVGRQQHFAEVQSLLENWALLQQRQRELAAEQASRQAAEARQQKLKAAAPAGSPFRKNPPPPKP